MGNLTNEQRYKLLEFLGSQGLTFKPLLDEMIDHISCDLEDRLSQGFSFDEAWHQSIGEIPDNHFRSVQRDTLEMINRRFTWSRWLSYFALGSLFCSMIFKVLHLPLADEILVLSFVFIASSLLTSTLSGIYVNKEKRGAILVVFVVAGATILLVGYGFKILHFPLANNIVLLGVTMIIGSLLANTLFVYKNAAGVGNLLTFLHEKYTPGIERFLMLLLFPLAVYKTISILIKGSQHNIPNIVLLVVIFGASLQFIALNWRIIEKNIEQRNHQTLICMIISLLCFTLPFLGEYIPLQIRIIIIVIFSSVSGWLALKMEHIPGTIISSILVALVPIIFLNWGLVRLHVIPPSFNKIFFNLPVLLILIVGLLICKKHGTMRTYMIISLSSYLFEYTH